MSDHAKGFRPGRRVDSRCSSSVIDGHYYSIDRSWHVYSADGSLWRPQKPRINGTAVAVVVRPGNLSTVVDSQAEDAIGSSGNGEIGHGARTRSGSEQIHCSATSLRAAAQLI